VTHRSERGYPNSRRQATKWPSSLTRIDQERETSEGLVITHPWVVRTHEQSSGRGTALYGTTTRVSIPVGCGMMHGETGAYSVQDGTALSRLAYAKRVRGA
jgi:hypothetical protein